MTSTSRHRQSGKTAKRRVRSALTDRKGVASVLAMMFLVIFGSLAATMGIVAQGNLRTARTHLQVSRALASAEAGLEYAERRLESAVRRFVLDRGEITEDLALALWMGTYDSSHGTIEVRDPVGFSEATPPAGIAEALANVHAAATHQVYGKVPNDGDLPYIDQATGQVITRPIGFDSGGEPSFQIIYTPLADARYVRVTVIGRDGDVQRTISVDYLLAKRLRFAIMSPNRIMLGKNVQVQGSIGSRYDELDFPNGHPIVARSDFYGLSSSLDAVLDEFYANLPLYDVDGDGRLRVGHSVESQGIPSGAYDVTGDGFVDDYDLFLAEFDTLTQDGRVVYDADLAAAAGYPGLSVEFDVDLDLARLIDQSFPDRNRDGVVDDRDVALGYNDGILCRLDYYAKVHGSLGFKVSAQEWETAQGDHWQAFVHGARRPDRYEPAVSFNVSDDELLALDAADFTSSQDSIAAIAEAGQSFEAQVSAQLGSGAAEYIPPGPDTWEQMPWRSPGFYDWYQRPIYRNMTFKNVVIPMGTNALFENCTFIGATKVETYSDNTHVNWNYYGTKELAPDGTYREKYEILDKEDIPDGQQDFYANYDQLPDALYIDGERVRDTKPWSNNVRFHDCEFRGSVVTTATQTFTHVRNKLQFTGSTVFIEPSVGGSGADVTEAQWDKLKRSSMMAPGYSVDIGTFNSPASQDVNLRGTIITGVLDIRGNTNVVGSLLMTYSPTMGEGALAYGGNPANFNSTFGYFGPEDGDGESLDPRNFTDTNGDGQIDIGIDYSGDGQPDPWEGYGKIRIIHDPDIPLPDGLMTPLQIVIDPDSYREGK